MKYLIVIITLVITINSFGQNDLKKIDLNEKYSWRNHSQDELNEYYFGLKPIKESKVKYLIRFQKDGQIVDLYSNNGIDFSGQLIRVCL
jgi:hypothetical protein